MRHGLAALFLLVIILVINCLIVRKELLLSEGKPMLLQLAPRDPRSLMQGDYMVLRYAIAREAPIGRLDASGCLVVTVDGQQMARFARVHDGEPLAANEALLMYRNRNGLRIGTETFMFQEGDAARYSSARYGELRVAPNGECILVGLRGEDLKPL